METPKKPAKTTINKATVKKKAKVIQPNSKKRFDDDEDDDDDGYSIPLEDMDYDSLKNFDDED